MVQNFFIGLYSSENRVQKILLVCATVKIGFKKFLLLCAVVKVGFKKFLLVYTTVKIGFKKFLWVCTVVKVWFKKFLWVCTVVKVRFKKNDCRYIYVFYFYKLFVEIVFIESRSEKELYRLFR